MNCIDYMESNVNIFSRTSNAQYKLRDTFHIGTVTITNKDNTFDLLSSNNSEFNSVPAMNAQTSDSLKQGNPVLFLHGSEKSLTQIYDLSPWVIGTQMKTAVEV